jgi:hypothetical protein
MPFINGTGTGPSIFIGTYNSKKSNHKREKTSTSVYTQWEVIVNNIYGIEDCQSFAPIPERQRGLFLESTVPRHILPNDHCLTLIHRYCHFYGSMNVEKEPERSTAMESRGSCATVP